MRTMQRYIVENQEQCARVAVRDSGKTLLDALIGEVLVTCEKLSWLASSGEWLGVHVEVVCTAVITVKYFIAHNGEIV